MKVWNYIKIKLIFFPNVKKSNTYSGKKSIWQEKYWSKSKSDNLTWTLTWCQVLNYVHRCLQAGMLGRTVICLVLLCVLENEYYKIELLLFITLCLIRCESNYEIPIMYKMACSSNPPFFAPLLELRDWSRCWSWFRDCGWSRGRAQPLSESRGNPPTSERGDTNHPQTFKADHQSPLQDDQPDQGEGWDPML